MVFEMLALHVLKVRRAIVTGMVLFSSPDYVTLSPLIPLLFLLSLSSSFSFFSSPLAFLHALCSCYSRLLSAPGPVKRPHTRASGKPGVFCFVSRRALPGTHYVYFLIVLEKSIWSRTGKSRAVHLGIPVGYQNPQRPT